MSAVTDRRVDGLRRRRVVVLHADVADYSRLMADDEAATVETMRTYQTLVAAAVTDVGGTLVNFVGDSFLAVFADARSAMQAAVRICTAVREHNADRPRSRRAFFRLGLDAGDVVTTDDGRHFGDPLNIAARIQAIAQVGGINVTEAVYTELDEPELRLVSLGARRLKNIPEPVRVYRLAGVGPLSGDGPTTTPPTPAVAVLPMHHAADATDRTVAEALRLEVVEALGALAGLRVVDHRASDGHPADRSGGGHDANWTGDGHTAHWARGGHSAHWAGDGHTAHGPRDVGASYALHTGVVRSGARLRVYATLLELETMNRVWGARWEGTTDDLFALQDRVAADTMRAMEIELVVGQPAMLYRSELDAAERAAVYQGWHQLDHGTREGWRRAVELFTSVVRSRPDSVTGYGLAAFAHWLGAVEGWSDTPTDDLRTAAWHAARGIEMEDPSGLSNLVQAALRLHDGSDLHDALSHAEHSLSLRPTCDVSFAVLGSVRRYLGDWRAAIEAWRRAHQLGPTRRPWFATVEASAWYVGERYHEAIQVAEWIVDRQPDNIEALLVLAAAQQALELTRRARATVAAVLDQHPDVRRDDVARRHPFQDPSIVERWTAHLAAAGLP